MLSILALTVATLAHTPPTEFAVHEWGTFTSFSGPHGRAMPYYVRIAEDLPPFVQARFVGERWLNADTPEFTKAALHATQRMETPVIYFHAPRQMEVRVEVSFPAGLITEVYPPVSSFTPAKLPEPSIPSAGSSVVWDRVRIVPYTCCDFLEFKDAGKSHYAHARFTETDAVHVEHDGVTHDERFLFYRGVGNPSLDVQARALGSGRLVLDTALPGPFDAFTIENQDGKLRFGVHAALKPGAEVKIPDASAPAPTLEAAMTAALTRAGLTQHEAKAMVATWKHHWFDEPGTRMLVILPQPLIDSILPLNITPTPDKTTRVFVSRLEVLTPERQAWLESLLERHDNNPSSPQLQQQLEPLGRFRQPALEIAREALELRKGC